MWRLVSQELPHEARWKKQQMCLYVNGDLCFQNPNLGNRFEVLLDREQLVRSELIRYQGANMEYGFEIISREDIEDRDEREVRRGRTAEAREHKRRRHDDYEAKKRHSVDKENAVREKLLFTCESMDACREWLQAINDAKTFDRTTLVAMAISSSAQRKAEQQDSSPGARRPSIPSISSGAGSPSRLHGLAHLKVQQLSEPPSPSSSRGGSSISPSRASSKGPGSARCCQSEESPGHKQVDARKPLSPRPRQKEKEKEAPAAVAPAKKPSDEDKDKVLNLEKELSKKRKDRVAAAFTRLKDEGEIHRDYLGLALDLIGFQHPVLDYISELFKSVTSYATLDYGEFIKFVKLYDEKLFEDYIPVFNRFDDDRQGIVDISSMDEILRCCHLSIASNALKDLLLDAADNFKVDDFRLSRVSEGYRLGDFKRLVDLLRDREGFSFHDLERFKAVFKRFDREQKGKMATQDLFSAVSWLAFSFEYYKKVEQIVTTVDIGGANTAPGYLCETDFLVCLRKVREHDDSIIEDYIASVEHSGDAITQNGLLELLRRLGYMPDMEAIEEALIDAGLSAHHDLRNAEVYRFLDKYRQREGLSREEVAEIDIAFERYRDGDSVPVGDVGKVLRWMGYLTSWDLQLKLVAEVDIDHSGTLDHDELKKLVRRYREREIMTLKKTFQDSDTSSKGYLNKSGAIRALHGVGCSVKASEIQPLLEGRVIDSKDGNDDFDDEEGDDLEIDFYQFVHIATALRQRIRLRYHDNAGYTEEELVDLKSAFQKYDVDNSGDISADEVRKLINEVFAELQTAEFRPHLKKILEGPVHGAHGGMDFPDFLLLMRQFHDLSETERLKKETQAIAMTGFTLGEVEEFRALFMGGEEGSAVRTSMSFDGLKSLIDSIAKLRPRDITQLQEIFWTVIMEGEDDHHVERPWERHDESGIGRQVAHFPEFLKIMQRLLDTNFAGIMDIAERMANESVIDESSSQSLSRSPPKKKLSIASVLSSASGTPTNVLKRRSTQKVALVVLPGQE